MDNNSFGQNQLPNEALVVLSEAASGLHEVLRNQRPMQHRVPEAKDFHNMSFMGSYGTHLLHNFPPQLLQSFNPTLLSNNTTGNFFANERLMSKTMLSNFQFSSAFTPPKYIGIPIDQNLFSGCESFRTDSTSPTCTSQDSLEAPNEYDCDKSGSPRSNNSDPKDQRQFHSASKHNRNYMSEFCPVCGLQLSSDDWNSHFLAELDRLYKLSCGIDRTNFLPDPYQNHENLIRSKHNRWETFQRIQNNRQGRFKIKVRKRKYGRDLFFMENLFCRSCPICRRKFSLDSEKDLEDDMKSNLEHNAQVNEIDVNCECVSGSDITPIRKIETTKHINADGEDCVSNSNNIWDINMYNNEKNKIELPTTSHQLYMADSCEEINYFDKDQNHNDSDEDIIVDDEISKPIKKPRCEEQIRQNNKIMGEDAHSEPQVTSSEESDNNQKPQISDEESLKLSKNENFSSSTNNELQENGDYKCFISGLKRSVSIPGTTFLFQPRCTHS